MKPQNPVHAMGFRAGILLLLRELLKTITHTLVD
jgi:hypothetical protein